MPSRPRSRRRVAGDEVWRSHRRLELLLTRRVDGRAAPARRAPRRSAGCRRGRQLPRGAASTRRREAGVDVAAHRRAGSVSRTAADVAGLERGLRARSFRPIIHHDMPSTVLNLQSRGSGRRYRPRSIRIRAMYRAIRMPSTPPSASSCRRLPGRIRRDDMPARTLSRWPRGTAGARYPWRRREGRHCRNRGVTGVRTAGFQLPSPGLAWIAPGRGRNKVEPSTRSRSSAPDGTPSRGRRRQRLPPPSGRCALRFVGVEGRRRRRHAAMPAAMALSDACLPRYAEGQLRLLETSRPRPCQAIEGEQQHEQQRYEVIGRQG